MDNYIYKKLHNYMSQYFQITLRLLRPKEKFEIFLNLIFYMALHAYVAFIIA